MPDKDFYDGLSPAEQLDKFNNHHHDPTTRHISSYESQMLDGIGEMLSEPASGSDSGGIDDGETTDSGVDPLMVAKGLALAAVFIWMFAPHLNTLWANKAAPHLKSLWADKAAPSLEKLKSRATGGTEPRAETLDGDEDQST